MKEPAFLHSVENSIEKSKCRYSEVERIWPRFRNCQEGRVDDGSLWMTDKKCGQRGTQELDLVSCAW